MSKTLEDLQRTSTEFAGVDLVGTVGTMYSDPQNPRFELALETAEHYNNAGVPLLVVDNSGVENIWVRAAFRERGAVILAAEAGGGIARQRMQGVAFAADNGAKKIVGHEPEKTLLVSFAPTISEALEHSDVLVIGRTQEAEDSLPPVQKRTEHLAGWILEKTLGIPPDSLSGGRGFSRAGAECLRAYPVDRPNMNNWIYLYDVVLRAQERGLRVGSLAVDLIHPRSMVEEETGNPTFDAKRYYQFNLQLGYLLKNRDISVTQDSLALVGVVLRGLRELPEPVTEADISDCEAFLRRVERVASTKGYSLDKPSID